MAGMPIATEQQLCADVFGGVFAPASAEPLAQCQWDMSIINTDIVNMSLFADPWLFYCGNDAEQRALMRELQSAARYAQQNGVLLVASAGNESIDLQHPIEDTISPDGPDDTPITRSVGNNCRVIPAELPGTLTVTATGPVGYLGYTMNIADYSSIGGDLTAPGGDYFAASGTVQDAVLAAMPAGATLR